MKAWLTHGFNDMRLTEVPYPVLKPGWAIVRVLVVQPSITEVQLFQGVRSNGYDLVVERLAEGPQALFGHEFAAEIVEVDEDNDRGFAKGDRVAATHTVVGTIGRHFAGCFAEYAAVPLDALVSVPDELSDWEVAALQPLSSCVRIVLDLGVSLGDTVLVLGQGVMGLNSAQVAKAAGADTVIGVDRRRDLLDIAERLGVDRTLDASVEETSELVRRMTDGKGVSIVIEAASGSPTVGLSGGATVTDAVACASKGGKIMSLAHYHAPVAMDFNVCRRKNLTYLFPQSQAGVKDMALAARLVAQHRVQVEPMITHKLVGIEALPEAMEITGNKAAHGALNPAQVRIN
jgi:threonine dehydrogenase-like Zn-dependent dehydrogenase